MGNTGSSTHEGRPTTTTTSTTQLLELIDWEALPAATRQTIRTLGPLMQEGCSQSETAKRLGIPEARVAAMRREMRDAIVEQAYARLDELEPRVQGLVAALRHA